MSNLAIDGGTPIRPDSKPWPIWPVHNALEENALLDVLHSGNWWSVDGTRVEEFAKTFAAFQGAEQGICVTNGSHALEIALRALGIGCGDEVIVPPYTFVATASSTLAVSAAPVFVDIEPGTLNIDPARIEEAITPRTKAIIPVHIGGRPADMDGVLAIAKKHGLAVIEDAAQAPGAEWRGKKVGALGDCGTFSFQASKNLNAGEGGIILANDTALAGNIWSVANVGRLRHGEWYEHAVLGSNYRMTEWQGAILLAQLTRLPEQIERRTLSAAALTALLDEIPGITTLTPDPRITVDARHLFCFRYNSHEFGGHTRDEFLAALAAEGVDCGDGYLPLYREGLFRNKAGRCQIGSPGAYDSYIERCPVCEEVCGDVVWIWQNMLLAEPEEMADIANAIIKIQEAWS